MEKKPIKNCSECGKPLPVIRKKHQVVCTQPKLSKNSKYSHCQREKNRKDSRARHVPATRRTEAICTECKEPLATSYTNQTLCKRPIYLRKYFIEWRTECELKHMKAYGRNWRVNNIRNTTVVEKPIMPLLPRTYKDTYVKPVLIEKERVCLKCDKKFTSTGNRICDPCHVINGRSEYNVHNIRFDTGSLTIF